VSRRGGASPALVRYPHPVALPLILAVRWPRLKSLEVKPPALLACRRIPELDQTPRTDRGELLAVRRPGDGQLLSGMSTRGQEQLARHHVPDLHGRSGTNGQDMVHIMRWLSWLNGQDMIHIMRWLSWLNTQDMVHIMGWLSWLNGQNMVHIMRCLSWTTW
jgi:hypothetical protein